MAPYWIAGINWTDSAVTVDLPRQAIQDAPAYDPTVLIDGELEMGLYSHYGRASYWAKKPPRPQPAATG